MSLVKNWKTPTLVMHGGRDYRVVDAQGIATFTALQRRGIPSRFLYFPDENHWVFKPAHSKRWHEEVLAWIDRYARGMPCRSPCRSPSPPRVHPAHPPPLPPSGRGSDVRM